MYLFDLIFNLKVEIREMEQSLDHKVTNSLTNFRDILQSLVSETQDVKMPFFGMCLYKHLLC